MFLSAETMAKALARRAGIAGGLVRRVCQELVFNSFQLLDCSEYTVCGVEVGRTRMRKAQGSGQSAQGILIADYAKSEKMRSIGNGNTVNSRSRSEY